MAGGAGADPPGRRELVLHLLRTSKQPRSIGSLADELGVHPNTVRFHLDALLRAGRVEQLLGDPTGPGRPPILFRATHRMDPAGPTNYRLLAGMLTAHLAASSPHPAEDATRLGRAWGPRVLGVDQDRPARRLSRTRAVQRVVDALADLGFEPEPPRGARDTAIRLRHCPFLDLVDEHADVICPLHLGLMQGALAALDAGVTAEALDPFVEPDLCVAHLAGAGARAGRSAPASPGRRGRPVRGRPS